MAPRILPENELPSPLAAALAEALACSNPRPGRCNPPRAFGSTTNPYHHPCCPARLLPAALAAVQAVLAGLARELEELGDDDSTLAAECDGLEMAVDRLREVAGLAGEGAGE
jgi:hypothetical protein